MTGLNDAYSLDSVGGAAELYRNWASTYDDDFLSVTGYQYGHHVARIAAAELAAAGLSGGAEAEDRGSRPTVCDVGCGTGVVAVEFEHFADVACDGIDLSPEMLEVAGAKRRADGAPLYRHLIEVDLTRDPQLESGYDAVVSAGLFTFGHLGPDVLPDVVALARPGGVLVIGVNAEFHEAQGFGAAFDALVSAGVIDGLRLEEVPIYTDAPDGHEGSTAAVVVARRCTADQ